MPEVVEFENQPDDEEVLQEEEPDESSVLVRVGGVVRTQDLPRKALSTKTFTVGQTAVRILVADPRRAIARIVASGTSVLISEVPIGTGDLVQAFALPIGTVIPIQARTALWAITQTGTAQVGVLAEYWANGND